MIRRLALCGAVAAACADTDITPPDSDCETLGERRCTAGAVLEDCQQQGAAYRWVTLENCADMTTFGCEGEPRTFACTPDLGCTPCPPGAELCAANEIDILQCSDAGEIDCQPVRSCRPEEEEICVAGDAQADCPNACEIAVENASYVGCEYYAVDLDNANVGEALNAAAQQFAVVLSNPSPSLDATVIVELNAAPVGEPYNAMVVAGPLDVGPRALEVIELPAREVDGSPPGEFDTGTHTALTSNAYRITASAPIIAYQFNPLENFDVFSNDASLLVPTSALSSGGKSAQSNYLAIGWPQTIADADCDAKCEPKDKDCLSACMATDFGEHLRSTLTIVGTEDDTTVAVQLSTDIVGTEAITDVTAGSVVEVVLGPFDVLNLETGSFNADFTGSNVIADRPVVVFSGNEASDVPYFPGLSQRQCCADHLEEQLSPTHTLGTTFVAVRSPSRTCALHDAGSDVRCEEDEYDVFRFVGTGEFPEVETSLPSPNQSFGLDPGRPRDVLSYEDFWIRATGAIEVGQFITSQWVVCGPGNNDQPCGDPAFILLPPVEQYRTDYLFLVPDKYAFDYLLIAAPAEVIDPTDISLRLNDQDITDLDYCVARPIVEPVPVQDELVDFVTITCALSRPEIDNGPPATVDDGLQYDGVHRLTSNRPVGLAIYGFDAFVSYGYAGGTNLLPINLQ